MHNLIEKSQHLKVQQIKAQHDYWLPLDSEKQSFTSWPIHKETMLPESQNHSETSKGS